MDFVRQCQLPLNSNSWIFVSFCPKFKKLYLFFPKKLISNLPRTQFSKKFRLFPTSSILTKKQKDILPPLLIDTGSLFEWARSPYLLEQIQDRVVCANCPWIWLTFTISVTHIPWFVSALDHFELYQPTQDNGITRVSSQCGPFAVILRHQPTFCLAFRAVKFGRLFLRRSSTFRKKKLILIFRTLLLPAERSRNSMRL